VERKGSGDQGKRSEREEERKGRGEEQDAEERAPGTRSNRASFPPSFMASAEEE